ncbi:MAG: dTDP-4-dehydrorhamnose reductase [Chloracidobacterium sp.]|uniref:dTDP-4-dehydrorhamnose reductase n=1 Tax=Chloracidobacterium validum TaxID=2821543 RepID=A0ABX8B560_9BACT|nr:dTDP-4-dehydrorhamnose reductase [Chloracidobacterium validum]QUW02107.1 dTDP-4-dehydrorhamnose reductase [Chloracidobacterium validum]
MVKLVVTGATGLLGRHVTDACDRFYDIVALARSDLDISDANAVSTCLNIHRPAVVINCAAMTNVDACETDRAAAFRHNAEGPRHMAEAAAAIGAYFIHISTDYVFDGTSSLPYQTTDAPHPISVYGESKLAGERAVQAVSPNFAVVRVAGLFGRGGKNFASVIGDLLTRPGVVKGITDNRILPSYAADVATYLRSLANARAGGLFHAVSSGTPCSWYDFATLASAYLGTRAQATVVGVTEAELGRPAKRPMSCVLAHSADAAPGLPVLRDWRDALQESLSAWKT